MSIFAVDGFQSVESPKNFVIPPTIMSDYHNWVYNTDTPNYTFDFRILRDWYDQFEAEYKPEYLRAEYYPINWKSKMGNSDANKNFGTDYTVKINKGDIVLQITYDESGTPQEDNILMLNWDIQDEINRQLTQAIKCNHFITVTRKVDAQTDARGMVISTSHDEVIVDNLPCVMSEYAGRPDYAITQGNPGVHADMLTQISMQYNAQTKDIRINDEFTWMYYTYRIINMSYAEVDINQTHGILTFYAKRVAGEDT